jgi:hypothetical protein
MVQTLPKKKAGEKKVGARQKGSALKGARKAASGTAQDLVVIDYPRENETIVCQSYAIRISAADAVEVSVDGADWRPCRYAVGHWWFDWADCTSGPHRIIARLCSEKGAGVAQSEPRLCRREVTL